MRSVLDFECNETCVYHTNEQKGERTLNSGPVFSGTMYVSQPRFLSLSTCVCVCPLDELTDHGFPAGMIVSGKYLFPLWWRKCGFTHFTRESLSKAVKHQCYLVSGSVAIQHVTVALCTGLAIPMARRRFDGHGQFTRLCVHRN